MFFKLKIVFYKFSLKNFQPDHSSGTHPDSVQSQSHNENSTTQSPQTEQRRSAALRLVSYNDAEDDDDPKDSTIMEISEEETISSLPPEEPKIEIKVDEKFKKLGIVIPDAPRGKFNREVQDKLDRNSKKVATSYEKVQHKVLDMNKIIQERKEFRNPSIYEKLISFCDINELGTNYPPEIYDPSTFGKESYYEELARVQKAEMDKLEKTKKETSVMVVTGSKKPSAISDEEKKRKSKWDQPAPAPSAKALTTTATGTKTTVISAFGSLPKKPKPS